MTLLGARRPRSLAICALLDKQLAVEVRPELRFVGFPGAAGVPGRVRTRPRRELPSSPVHRGLGIDGRPTPDPAPAHQLGESEQEPRALAARGPACARAVPDDEPAAQSHPGVLLHRVQPPARPGQRRPGRGLRRQAARGRLQEPRHAGQPDRQELPGPAARGEQRAVHQAARGRGGADPGQGAEGRHHRDHHRRPSLDRDSRPLVLPAAPAPGGRQPGLRVRQVQGEAARGRHAQDHVRRRRGR